MGIPPGFEPGISYTTMHCAPQPCHSGVAARAAISCPYETRFYDVIGLIAFSLLSLVGFCWTVVNRVKRHNWKFTLFYNWWKLARTAWHADSLSVSIHTHINKHEIHGRGPTTLRYAVLIRVTVKVMSSHWTQYDCQHPRVFSRGALLAKIWSISPHPALVPMFQPEPVPLYPTFVPQNFYNFSTFLYRFWPFLSLKLPLKAVFHALKTPKLLKFSLMVIFWVLWGNFCKSPPFDFVPDDGPKGTKKIESPPSKM